MMSFAELALLLAAGIGAGFVNAIAGGGSIFTFPALIAAGIPPLAANVTNTVALCPGYVGGVIGQWRDLKGQRRRIALLSPIAAAGGLIGGLLLLHTDEKLFELLVPWLVLAATLLLAMQDKVRGWLQRGSGTIGLGWAAIPLLIAAVYGGYFGAGLSVIFLAVLGLAIEDTLTRLNAAKQVLALVVNLVAALLFIGAGPIVWPAALAVGAGTLAGGALGGRAASVISAALLRKIVIVSGFVLAAIFAFGGL